MSESSPSRTRKTRCTGMSLLPGGNNGKDSKIRWVESTGMVNHGFDFPDNDQQEPSESKGHVHVSQHRVRLEYIMMQQAFPEDFPTGTNGLETEQAFADFLRSSFGKLLIHL